MKLPALRVLDSPMNFELSDDKALGQIYVMKPASSNYDPHFWVKKSTVDVVRKNRGRRLDTMADLRQVFGLAS